MSELAQWDLKWDGWPESGRLERAFRRGMGVDDHLLTADGDDPSAHAVAPCVHRPAGSAESWLT